MSERIVTPEQYKQGWLTWPTGSRPMTLIKKLPDGNYLVTDLKLKDSDTKTKGTSKSPTNKAQEGIT